MSRYELHYIIVEKKGELEDYNESAIGCGIYDNTVQRGTTYMERKQSIF